MLTIEQREILRKNIHRTDYEAIRQRYQQATGLSITWSYIRRILTGERGHRPDKHNIIALANAISISIQERRQLLAEALQPIA